MRAGKDRISNAPNAMPKWKKEKKKKSFRNYRNQTWTEKRGLYPRQIRRRRQHQRHRHRRVRVDNGAVRRRRAGGRVDDLEADFLAGLGAVEAVCVVDFGDVLGLCEGDVCALSFTLVSLCF